MNCDFEGMNLDDIIINEKLKVHFQPVISVSRKMVVGIEGLVRGIGLNENEIIPPNALFEAAGRAGTTLELDRVCREKVLEAFGNLYRHHRDKLLFLNMDASVLDQAAGSNYLTLQAQKYNIDPQNIVIEINEAKVQDSTALKRFSETYQKHGFMIALDDVGTGFSNMDRILLARPDVIKVDISLVKNIHTDYYKRGVFKSLVSLANKLGTLVVAEGVEAEDEAVQILRLGGHMIQGYYFAKPQEIKKETNIFSNEKIEDLSRHFSRFMKSSIMNERDKNKQLNNIVNLSITQIAEKKEHEFDNELMTIVWENKNIECAYILNEQGIQVSNTICYYDKKEVKKNLIFYSARMGTDHSMERYYYPLISARLTKHITEPYVSLASGNLCITFSKFFKNNDNKKYILCMDFNTNDAKDTMEIMKDEAVTNLIFNINGKSVNEISKMISKLNQEMIKDSLTNTYNRRYIDERLLVDVFSASNENQPVSVIMADLDHFKKVNDTYGHLAGDHVLKEFAKIAKRFIRKDTDWVARYGGEEFLIVLLHADENAVYRVAEKVRRATEKAEIYYDGRSIKITASFGTYTLHSPKMTCEQLIDQADKNLYRAKNNGRNRTICLHPEQAAGE